MKTATAGTNGKAKRLPQYSPGFGDVLVSGELGMLACDACTDSHGVVELRKPRMVTVVGPMRHLPRHPGLWTATVQLPDGTLEEAILALRD